MFRVTFQFLIGLIYISDLLCEYIEYSNSYPNSVIQSVDLLKFEDQMIGNLSLYAEQLLDKIHTMRLGLQQMNAENEKALNDPETYLSNPLNVFSLVRRMHDDWKQWHSYMQKPVGEAPLKAIQNFDELMPTQQDHNESCEAIHKIKNTYELSAENMAMGQLGDLHTDTQLSALDCFQIGAHLFTTKHHAETMDWMQMALRQYNESQEQIYTTLDFDRAQIWHQIAEIHKRKKNYQQALLAIDTALKYKPEEDKYKLYKASIEGIIAYHKVCRGKAPTRPLSKLRCYYLSYTSPYLILAPIKEELIHLDPEITLYHDVIYKNEINELMYLTLQHAKQNNMNATDESAALLESKIPIANSPRLAKLHQRITDMTYMKPNGRDLQVLNYGVGGYYYNQFEQFNMSVFLTKDKPAERETSTLLFYLNNVSLGGTTTFPLLNKIINAKSGDAIFWHHQNSDGFNEPKIMQACCPIVLGSKWVAAQILTT